MTSHAPLRRHFEPHACACAVLNSSGRIQTRSGGFDAIVSERDGLSESAGALVAADPQSAARLAEAIVLVAAVERGESRSQALVIDRPSGRLGYQVILQSFRGSGGPWVNIAISDPCEPIADYSEPLRQAYGLTAAEASVAALIVQGHDVAQTAQARGVSHYTVRALLKRVFAKTGVSRQVDLVRLVLAGALGCAASRAVAS